MRPGRLLSAGVGVLLGAAALTACGPAPAATQSLNASRAASPGATISSSPIKSSFIATARAGSVSVRDTPAGEVVRRLASPASGAPLTFLVLERRPGWLKVALPVRPNGSSGWIASGAVDLTVTEYQLVVSRAHHYLEVDHRGRRIARHRIGVGRAATPTPPGRYYLTELIRPENPHGIYGPYAFGLSAFSETLTSFGGGPGQIGLHGTDTPHGLGHDVSHGCLRVSNEVIEQLAATLPLGTPVVIT